MSPRPVPGYVDQVLELYRHAPGTRGRARRADRLLAGRLRDRDVPLDVVQVALLLAIARRSFRGDDAPSLAPIASLHYFLPVIDEVLASPPSPSYLQHLRRRLASAAPVLAAPLDHQLP